MRLLVPVLVTTLTGVVFAQPPAAPPLLQEPQTILLWPSGAPGAQGQDDKDKPAITVYMPGNTTGPMTAVIIAPGGSYTRLSITQIGPWTLMLRFSAPLAEAEAADRAAGRVFHDAVMQVMRARST